jgi:hypothetical protein
MAVFLCAGVTVQLMRGVPSRLSAPSRLVAEGAVDISPLRDSCGDRMPKRFDAYCVFGRADGPIVAVLGDSHGKELFWQASRQMAGRSFALQPFLWNACAPFAAVTTSSRRDRKCLVFHQKMRDYILGDARIRTVVFAVNWPAYFNCPLRRRCATSLGRPDLSSRPDDPARLQALSQAMSGEIDAYRVAGKTVVLVYPVPQMPWDVPRFMAARLRASLGVRDVGVARSAHEARTRAARAFLDREAAKPGVLTIDPADSLCSSGDAGFCRAQLDGRPLYFNFGHINGLGAGPIAARLLRLLAGLPQLHSLGGAR